MILAQLALSWCLEVTGGFRMFWIFWGISRTKIVITENSKKYCSVQGGNGFWGAERGKNMEKSGKFGETQRMEIQEGIEFA